MATSYKFTSPYSQTPFSGRFLSYYVHRQIPRSMTETIMLLPAQFRSRPDLLSLQLYGTVDLWWVIPQRNGLEDPVFDLVPGMLLFIPPPSLVRGLIN